MNTTKQTYKLTDDEFKEAYWLNNGNCALTALYIQQNYNIPYSRQAVTKRAKNFTELKIADIAVLENECNSGLLTFVNDEKNDIRLRSRIYLHLSNAASKVLLKRYDLRAKNKN